MHIRVSVFKFGDTPFYSINGALAKGLVPKAMPKRSGFGVAYGIFASSLALLLLALINTSGRSYAARASYYFDALLGVPYIPASAALAPLSGANLTTDGIAPPKKSGNMLSIPKLRVLAPIIETSKDPKAFDADLERGVIRWPQGASPGEKGTTILLGHSSAPLFYKGTYGSVFALLDKLEKGDVIGIETSEGMLNYHVTERHVINPRQDNMGGQKAFAEYIKSSGGQDLILISCWPAGTRLQRIVVRAERLAP